MSFSDHTLKKTISRLQHLLKNIRGVLFDFDGLLANSEEYHYLSYNEVFKRYGHTLDREEYWLWWASRGAGPHGEIKRHGLEHIDPYEVSRAKEPIFSAYCQSGKIQLFDGVREVVSRMHKQGFQLAVATGSSAADARAVLAHQGIADLFHTIIGKEETKHRKPAPDAWLIAAARLQLPPDACIAFEDAEKGLTAAITAQIPCVIIRNPLNKTFDFPGAYADLPDMRTVLQALPENNDG